MENDYWASEEPTKSPRGKTRWWIGPVLLLSLFICALSAVLVPGGLGFLAGYGALGSQNHEYAIQHFQRGLGFIAENYPELAYTEFEIALRYDPSYEPARQKLREMQATVTGAGTPGAAEEDRVAAALLTEASDLAAGQQWDDAINRLEQLRALNASYQSQQVSDLLFQAYSEGGKAAIAASQIELARERFDGALALRSDPEIQRQRDLAVLYLDGQQAVGYNWAAAITKFSQLYQQEPTYDDVKQRLIDAYTQYGDVAVRQGAACLAVREYDGALAITSDAAVSSKRSQAMAQCRQAISVTPTPAATAASGEVYIAKVSKDASRPCGTGTGDVSGTVRDALQQPLAGVYVAYYADGINRVTTKTNASGQYQFTWGVDPGLFHIIILMPDGKTQSGVAADVQYPGSSKSGCHIVVDWQKVQ